MGPSKKPPDKGDAEALQRSAAALRFVDAAEIERFLYSLKPKERGACAAFCQCVSENFQPNSTTINGNTEEPGVLPKGNSKFDSPQKNSLPGTVESPSASSTANPGGPGADRLLDVSTADEMINSAVSKVLLGIEGELNTMRSAMMFAMYELQTSLAKDFHETLQGDTTSSGTLNRPATKNTFKPALSEASIAEEQESNMDHAGFSVPTFEFDEDPEEVPLDDDGSGSKLVGKRQKCRQSAQHQFVESSSPLCNLLTRSKKYDNQLVRHMLEGSRSKGSPVDLEQPLDEKSHLPPPLFYALGTRNVELVALLIEFGVDVTRKFPGPKSWNGLKKGRSAMEGAVERKEHFAGTVIAEQFGQIASLLEAEILRQTTCAADHIMDDSQLEKIIVPRSSSDPTMEVKEGDGKAIPVSNSRDESALEKRQSKSRISITQQKHLQDKAKEAQGLEDQFDPDMLLEPSKEVQEIDAGTTSKGVLKGSASEALTGSRSLGSKRKSVSFGSQPSETGSQGVGSNAIRKVQPLARQKTVGLSRHTIAAGAGAAEAATGVVNVVEHYEDCDPSIHYDLSKKIGEGSFGSVCSGTQKTSGNVRAIKKVPKIAFDQASDFWQEIDIMRQLDHPHILRLFATYEDLKHIYLVSELCAGGELFDALVETDCGFTEKIGAKLMKQMLMAVAYLHAHSICHRDLKPENFLLSQKSDVASAHVKLIDFGTAKCFADGELMTTKICTVHYVAPEILTKHPRPYTEVCDLWSIGVIMFLILCGEAPFNGADDMTVMKAIKKGKWAMEPEEVWRLVSDDAKELLRSMLEKDPLKRVTANKALHHKWIEFLAPSASGEALLNKSIVGKLRAFKSQNKLKKIAMQVIAQSLSDESIEHLKQAFLAIDSDNSGSLQVEEIEEAIRGAGMDPDTAIEMTQVLWEMAAGNNGEVNYTQFLGATIDRKHYLQEEAVKAAFNCFDVDGDGHITKEELAAVLGGGPQGGEEENSIGNSMQQALGMELTEVERILQEVDQDGDGQIDFKEFMDMMMNDVLHCGESSENPTTHKPEKAVDKISRMKTEYLGDVGAMYDPDEDLEGLDSQRMELVSVELGESIMEC